MNDSKLITGLLRRAMGIVTILSLMIGGQMPLYAVAKSSDAPGVQPAQQAVSTLHLSVISADDSDTYGITKGDAIDEFKYIINIDNTGTTEQRTPADGCSPNYVPPIGEPGYPESCNWVSVAGRASNSPVYTQGDQEDFPGGDFTVNGSTVELPAGRYLISVLADGYKIDGEHFTVPSETGEVTVEMQPYDLPTATLQAAVFEDMAPTNSAPDLPVERGLAGFRAHINDYIDEVTTDIFGNPLGAEYERDSDGNVVFDGDGAPTYVAGTGGVVLSHCYVVANGVDVGTVDPVDSLGRCPLAFTAAEDPLLAGDITETIEGDPIPVGAAIEGKVIIPNVGPNRYALTVTPPNNSEWIQTTTLEGNHDWDFWAMEGATGLDTEFVVASEPFPAAFFGYVRPSFNTMTGGSNTITGRGVAINAYIPPKGGMISGEGVRGGQPKDGNPIPNPVRRLFVSLSDLNANDQTVFVQEFGCEINPALDCTIPPEFEITGVPDGDYVLGVWDEPQDYIFDFRNVSVQGGQIMDVGDVSLLGWWTPIDGYVFNDLDEDGMRDEGEPGIPNFFISMRNRENSLMDRGSPSTVTDANGYYWLESAYPMNQWQIIEAYADGFHTTGITYWADNQPEPTTILGAGVDVNVLPEFSQSGHLDWGVKAYDLGTNGGIVGTISYDTTRNELNPAYAAIEDWQPSIANLMVNLYAPILCGTNPNTACDPTGLYELAQDGSYALGPLLNQYLSETWERPSGCIARDISGVPLVHGVDENALPLDPDAPCLEAPMNGVQFGPLASDVGGPDENFGASLDGNYGFGDGCFLAGDAPGLFDPDTGECVTGSFQSLPSNRDYLVKVEIPDDEFGRPLYKVTREEDINIANGDSFVPQVPPPACAGALHTVDVAGIGTDGYPAVDLFGDATVIVPPSTPTVNPTFVDILGTPYEGLQKPLCDTKLVHLSERKSIAPGFNFFTDVPLPGRFWGLLVDDLNWSSNPQQLLYGEKMGIAFAPIGIYDYTNRLIATAESDYNGLFDVLLPSTNRISCPTPSGVCANLYRFVGNDPGIPGRWNANYTPQYRTISAEFEAFPGLTIPADLAPTQVAVVVQLPGATTLSPIMCTLEATQPQLLAVSQPYADISGGPGSFTIDGFGFGATTGEVLLDNVALPTTSWADDSIDVTVPLGTIPGAHQLSVVSSGGLKTINGLTFHVFGTATGSVSAFPSNLTALDTFNSPPAYSFAANWSQDGSAYVVVDNSGVNHDYLRVRTNNGSTNNAWWTSPFGTSQEAYFTFARISGNPNANAQGLILKYNGSLGNAARFIAVTIDNNGTTDPEEASVRVSTKTGGGAPNEQLEITGGHAVFSDGDQLGARALSNGTIIVYKNGSEIGRVTVGATSGMSGRIGLRFEGTGGAATEARVEDFGGGNTTFTSATPNSPVLFEVGPGKPFSNIQSAIDAAAAQTTYHDSLVVVYPAAVNNSNPRYNGRGAYYENLIMYAPVQLQGVGPGGVRPDGSVVPGSIIDGIAFGGDTALALNWLGKVGTLTWDGNQDINDGQVIYVLASDTNGSATVRPTLTEAGSFNSTSFKPMIDGFNIRGGDQQGIPPNLTEVAGTLNPNANLPVQVVTQGGAIFANSYVTNLQITNNVIESNGGAYGSVRIGTPNLGDQHNDNLRIANNRFLANGGTNLAGAIGLFNGADNYEVANNDLCGNFSAEYGGAISHFGFSSNGKIHDNRIYFNRSYDEGAGIMIAGELATDPDANYGEPGGPQGSGAVDIYSNLIQANVSDDDGGGLRFLMAGNFPMNVYNNMIVNNISTHEGGGVALDDASNVRFYNNTVMNNKTTATAITSDGNPAPAGLSTGSNSAALQATLPGTAPTFSDPMLFNNVFYNNWAGTNAGGVVTGISTGDANPWDMGSLTSGILLSPTNSVLETSIDTNPSGSNSFIDPGVVSTLDLPLTFTNWGAFVTTIMVTVDLPPSLIGNYHLLDDTSPAFNLGVSSKSSISAPSMDIDGEARPSFGGFDSGADEIQGTVTADLSITKTDIQTTVNPGAVVPYSIVVSNAGPDTVNDVVVTDNVPAELGSVTWLCSTSSGGAVCDTASGSGNAISMTVDLPAGSSVLVTVYGTLSGTATGSLSNTASVAVPDGVTDPNLLNNTATDTDAIILPTLPTLGVLDSFTRSTNTTNLNTGAPAGVNWSYPFLVPIRVNNNQAQNNNGILAQAVWNGTTNVFGSKQGAAFTFVQTSGVPASPLSGTALILKASGGTPSLPANFIRVRYSGTQIIVESTSNFGVSYTSMGTFTATFATGEVLTAVANADGSVDVWKNSTFLGRTSVSSFTGGGRIGMQLPSTARVDNFSGGTVP